MRNRRALQILPVALVLAWVVGGCRDVERVETEIVVNLSLKLDGSYDMTIEQRLRGIEETHLNDALYRLRQMSWSTISTLESDGTKRVVISKRLASSSELKVTLPIGIEPGFFRPQISWRCDNWLFVTLWRFEGAFISQQPRLSLPCSRCEGTGEVECDDCDGTGWEYSSRCFSCKGTGMSKCPVCNGTGVLPVKLMGILRAKFPGTISNSNGQVEENKVSWELTLERLLMKEPFIAQGFNVNWEAVFAVVFALHFIGATGVTIIFAIQRKRGKRLGLGLNGKSR